LLPAWGASAEAAPVGWPAACCGWEELLQPAIASAVTETSDQITLRIVEPHQTVGTGTSPARRLRASQGTAGEGIKLSRKR
jgi:hypothetical protein